MKHGLLGFFIVVVVVVFSLVPSLAFAASATGGEAALLNLTTNWVGVLALAIFTIAYLIVIFEEQLNLCKSIPMIMAAGIIWAIIAIGYMGHGAEHSAALNQAAKHILEEYGELFLFLLVAVTYVNSLEERRVFEALKTKLIGAGFSYRILFWLTGFLAFFMSPLLDNLTTALVLGAVVVSIGKGSPKFIALACINVVVASNAGGAFSPFGDITTLMVWTTGKIEFFGFLAIFVPSLINFLIPAIIMTFAVPKQTPDPVTSDTELKPGAKTVIVLFGLTIFTAVVFNQLFKLPAAMGMMMGLGYLMVFSFFLKKKISRQNKPEFLMDSFKEIERVEWDTLLFFFGIIFTVGGLGVIGYLEAFSKVLYGDLGATNANIIIGILSAIVDNIPVMFAVLIMDPEMSRGQWLLVTLTAGVGGSLLSIGSAAGIALMGTARGYYNFMSHLKWTWAIALGYAASIWAHLLINASLF